MAMAEVSIHMMYDILGPDKYETMVPAARARRDEGNTSSGKKFFLCHACSLQYIVATGSVILCMYLHARVERRCKLFSTYVSV